jgi:hypothetical protein
MGAIEPQRKAKQPFIAGTALRLSELHRAEALCGSETALLMVDRRKPGSSQREIDLSAHLPGEAALPRLRSDAALPGYAAGVAASK